MLAAYQGKFPRLTHTHGCRWPRGQGLAPTSAILTRFARFLCAAFRAAGVRGTGARQATGVGPTDAVRLPVVRLKPRRRTGVDTAPLVPEGAPAPSATSNSGGVARTSPIRAFMVRWTKPADWSVDKFKEAQPTVQSTFKEWLGHKGHWMYQLECTVVVEPVPAPVPVSCPHGVAGGCDSSECSAAGAAWRVLAAYAVPPPAPPRENWHYQCYCYSTDKMRVTTLAGLLAPTMPGVHVQPASDNGRAALKKYSMKKDDTYRAGPWADVKIRAEYTGDDVKTFDQLWPFQKQIVEDVRGPPSDRTVNWVCNPAGCSGKTTLVKFLTKDEKCDALGLSHGNANDLANLVMNNPNHNCYVFDLPRTKPGSYHHSDIYAMIEKLKDGRVINLKYTTKVVDMKVPHVWVFANELPQFTSLTSDRLRVYGIEGSGPESRLVDFDFKRYEEYKREEAIKAEIRKLEKADEKKEIAREAKERYKKIRLDKAGAGHYDEKKDRVRDLIIEYSRPVAAAAAVESPAARPSAPVPMEDAPTPTHRNFVSPLTVEKLNEQPGQHHLSQSEDPFSEFDEIEEELALFNTPPASPIRTKRKSAYVDLECVESDHE